MGPPLPGTLLGCNHMVQLQYLTIDDSVNITYVSRYIARGEGEGILVSSSNFALLTVRLASRAETTGGRYPPQAGDIPDGFQLNLIGTGE